MAPRGTSRDEGGAYAQDEIVFSDRFRWIVGVRLDGVDVLGKAVVSPRTTLLMKPRSRDTVRVAFNRAFRAPSFVNSYLETTFRDTVNLSGGKPFEFQVEAVGNDRLEEETLTAYEAAYVTSFGRITASAAAYVNRTTNAIQFTQTASYSSGAPPPGWPLPPQVLDQWIAEGRGLPSEFSYRNFERIVDRGFELSGAMRVRTGLSVSANYSWQDRPEPKGVDLSELNIPPRHRFNAAVNAAYGRYFGAISSNVVDSAFWQDVLPAYKGWTAAYAIIDGAFGVYSSDRLMAVTVRGTNLLNSRIQQHAFGDVIRRMVTGEIRVRF
jgi:outer membrane receptor protein involved in Fe transport